MFITFNVAAGEGEADIIWYTAGYLNLYHLIVDEYLVLMRICKVTNVIN